MSCPGSRPGLCTRWTLVPGRLDTKARLSVPRAQQPMHGRLPRAREAALRHRKPGSSLSQLFTAAWSLAKAITFRRVSPSSVVAGLLRCPLGHPPSYQLHWEETGAAGLPSYEQPLAQGPGRSTVSARGTAWQLRERTSNARSGGLTERSLLPQEE